ncbi:MAG: AAA family ATPase [Methanogenium sp.]|jgi:exonuclease SbcC
MFRSIYGKNFQVHKEFKMDLTPGVNVIIGTSDEGKTAILRMINWITSNRPSGDSFKNWNAPKKESVCGEIELWDGKCVVLERENDKNSYVIFESLDGEELRLSAIKTDVPTEVSNILNLAEYNIQSQHQPYFLLQDTPGTVAKKLNDLVGLSIIDDLFSKIKSETRSLSAKVSVLTSDIKSSKEELNTYKDLDKIEIKVKRIEKLHAEAAVIASSSNQIEQKLSNIKSIRKTQADLAPLLSLESKTSDLVNKIRARSDVVAQISNVDKIVNSIKQIREKLEVEHIWISLESTYLELSNKMDYIQDVTNKNKKIGNILGSLKSLRLQIEQKKKDKKVSVKKYLDQIKEAGTCPTCDNKMTDKALKNLEKSLHE